MAKDLLYEAFNDAKLVISCACTAGCAEHHQTRFPAQPAVATQRGPSPTHVLNTGCAVLYWWRKHTSFRQAPSPSVATDVSTCSVLRRAPSRKGSQPLEIGNVEPSVSEIVKE